jgi:hypothetical protein
MELNPKHNGAIREEIGERLEIFLFRHLGSLPPQLCELARRFDEIDAGVSPSIVPGARSRPFKTSEPRPASIWLRDCTRRMTTFAKLLARKRQLLERLHEEKLGSHERDELERLLVKVNIHSGLASELDGKRYSEPRPTTLPPDLPSPRRALQS